MSEQTATKAAPPKSVGGKLTLAGPDGGTWQGHVTCRTLFLQDIVDHAPEALEDLAQEPLTAWKAAPRVVRIEGDSAVAALNPRARTFDGRPVAEALELARAAADALNAWAARRGVVAEWVLTWAVQVLDDWRDERATPPEVRRETFPMGGREVEEVELAGPIVVPPCQTETEFVSLAKSMRDDALRAGKTLANAELGKGSGFSVVNAQSFAKEAILWTVQAHVLGWSVNAVARAALGFEPKPTNLPRRTLCSGSQRERESPIAGQVRKYQSRVNRGIELVERLVGLPPLRPARQPRAERGDRPLPTTPLP